MPISCENISASYKAEIERYHREINNLENAVDLMNKTMLILPDELRDELRPVVATLPEICLEKFDRREAFTAQDALPAAYEEVQSITKIERQRYPLTKLREAYMGLWNKVRKDIEECRRELEGVTL